MKEENTTGKFIGAVLLGVGIGAALGLLFAPAKGSETRKKILDHMKDLADEVNDAIKQAREEAGKDEQTAAGNA